MAACHLQIHPDLKVPVRAVVLTYVVNVLLALADQSQAQYSIPRPDRWSDRKDEPDTRSLPAPLCELQPEQLGFTTALCAASIE